MVYSKIKGLYVIIDTVFVPHDEVGRVCQSALEGGARIIQLRAKDSGAKDFLRSAQTLRELTTKAGAVFIVNDRCDIAALSGADGVHLGQDDIPIEDARKILGIASIIGLSTHNPEEAVDAERRGADYISFGPVFATKTKKDAQPPKGLEALSKASGSVAIPLVAIGGITEETVTGVIGSGASSTALISEILLAGDVKGKVASIISKICSARHGEAS